MENSQKSVMIAVSHGLYDPWIKILHEGQVKTWLQDHLPQNVGILHFHGTPVNGFFQQLDKFHEQVRWSGVIRARILRLVDRITSFLLINYIPPSETSKLLTVEVENPVVHIKFPDTYVTYRWKELGLFRYFLDQTDYDYLFLTSTASYVNVTNLVSFVNGQPSTGVYAGAHPYPEASFISGACRLLSRDVVQFVVDNRRKFDVAVIEDMALGDLIRSGGFTPVFLPPNNLTSIEDINLLSGDELHDKFHFRLKSFLGTKRNDVALMLALHSRVKGDK